MMRPPRSSPLLSGAILAALAGLLTAASPAPMAEQPRLRHVGVDRDRGLSAAVVVEAGALVHTAMMLPDGDGGAARDARGQAARALANVERALQEAGSGGDHLVRLHVYVAGPAVMRDVEALLTQRFARVAPPAVTFVETAMPRPGLLVAMDGVGAAADAGEPGTRRLVSVPGLAQRMPRASHAAVQPAGPFVAVSGRAARGEFEPAIRETLEQLRGDLARVGLTFAHVVQIKSFLSDMSRAERLEGIVAEVLGGDAVPPQVVTEWVQDTIPAEIELIATAPPSAGARAAVEYVEPISGRYSRVARVNRGRPVFLSGLYGTSADPVVQVDEMFAGLAAVLREAGSDVRHLVKATYYVTDKRADERINAIRPTVFDPQGPPAASKLSVRGTGRPGRGSTFDMIAVTVDR